MNLHVLARGAKSARLVALSLMMGLLTSHAQSAEPLAVSTSTPVDLGLVGVPELGQAGVVDGGLSVKQEFTVALYQSVFGVSRDASLLTSEANPSISGTQPLGMLQLPKFGKDCCDVSTRRVGWISVLASMPLPLAHTSTAQTPEGEITLSYRIEEAEFLLSLDTGWCERVTGLLMHLDAKHPTSGSGALTVVLPLSILEDGSMQTLAMNCQLKPEAIDGTLGTLPSCARKLDRELTDCETEHIRRTAAIKELWIAQLQQCVNGWQVFQDVAVGAGAGACVGALGGPFGSVICAIGGAGVGSLWGVTNCYNSVKSTRDQALVNSAVTRDNCIDDAALHFERCLEDQGLVVGR